MSRNLVSFFHEEDVGQMGEFFEVVFDYLKKEL